MSIALGLALILLLTAATGYFVAQEFAYVAVDRNRLRQLAEDGDPAAERAQRVTSQLSFTLSAAQFGITVTALLVGYVSEPLVGRGLADLLGFTDLSYAARLSLSVTAVLVFSTVVQMVFGELAPKNLAIARTVPVALALSRSTLVYLRIIGPVVRLFDRASTTLLRRVGIEPVEELEHGATAEDLTRIIDESHAGGLLDDDLSEVLEGGLRFRELDAGEVMTPRVRVRTVPADATVAELVALLETGYSRFPVTGADGDDILGVVGMAEVLSVPRAEREQTAVGSLVTEPTVVPTSAPLPRVLEQIRADRRQMAIVVDEHGGFAGVVTFEDIAEEVVGEILDEDDAEVPGVVQTDTGGWVAPGHLRLDELETATGLELTTTDEFSTLSGLVLERLGRTAEVGDVVVTSARRGIPTEPDRTTSAEDSRRQPERERQRHEVGVRVRVTAVDRHVPSVVLVEVQDLLDDLQDPEGREPDEAREGTGSHEAHKAHKAHEGHEVADEEASR